MFKKYSKKVLRKIFRKFGFVHISDIKQTMTLMPFGDKYELTETGRTDELYREAKIAVVKSRTVSEALTRVSEHCRHQNELAMASSMVAFLVEENNNPMSGLLNALKRRSRQNPGEDD